MASNTTVLHRVTPSTQLFLKYYILWIPKEYRHVFPKAHVYDRTGRNRYLVFDQVTLGLQYHNFVSPKMSQPRVESG